MKKLKFQNNFFYIKIYFFWSTVCSFRQFEIDWFEEKTDFRSNKRTNKKKPKWFFFKFLRNLQAVILDQRYIVGQFYGVFGETVILKELFCSFLCSVKAFHQDKETLYLTWMSFVLPRRISVEASIWKRWWESKPCTISTLWKMKSDTEFFILQK